MGAAPRRGGLPPAAGAVIFSARFYIDKRGNMRTADTGIYDNRVRFAVRRMAGLLGGSVFLAGCIVALLDDRGSLITAGFFFFFVILIGAIPLLFRVGNKEPSTEVIDDEYGAFLPIQPGMNAQLFVFLSLTLVFYGLALAGRGRICWRSAWATAIFRLLVAGGLRPLMPNATRGALRARTHKYVGIFSLPHWRRASRAVHPVKNWLTYERGDSAAPRYRDTFELASGTPEPTVELDRISGNPNQTVARLAYCGRNPAARSDLGTSIALDRFTQRP